MPSCVFYHIIFLRKTTHCSPLPAFGNYVKIIPLRGDNQVDCLQTCFPLSLSPDSIPQPSSGSAAEHPWRPFLTPCPLLPPPVDSTDLSLLNTPLVAWSRTPSSSRYPVLLQGPTPPKTISRLKADPDFSYRSREPIFPVSSASL